ncbi:interleukin 12 receptor, beta 2a, like [Syngnathus typhle]|uniref:interleukin 12 receptor, beta 2a, like n=1 Tax=Syngnathus typhle TaxID=161592 RepID=UPI002A6A137A|nr:interleukin 12 receptor, beta 2a, like [Syngnathus typhle]
MAPRWLFSILIVNMAISFAAAGPPEPPSKPKCHIPCHDSCGVDIYCHWNHKIDPPTNSSLHWKRENGREEFVHTGASWSGTIGREHFSMNGELQVWVKAENKNGSAKSQVAVFNTGDIMKPSPPVISSSPQDPLEISWSSICDEPHLSLGKCHVQFRTQAETRWHEEEIGAQGSYDFDSLVEAGIVYEIQVRCSCATGLSSDWSAIHRICLETAPTGPINVWKDCGVPATNLDCAMTWKKLPLSQACGHILGYKVKLFSKHGTSVLMNISAAEPMDCLVCDGPHCHLNSSLKNISSAAISAYNAHGATLPAYITIPTTLGKVTSEHPIDVRMNTANLTVSWNLPSHLPDAKSFKEYVVQYKQAGSPLGKGFDWIRVNKSCTTFTFTGHFEKYRAYQVSLFAVRSNQESRLISSAIGYSCHGIPAKVRSFKVISIAATHATLFWEPAVLTEQNGQILYYQIGVHGQMAVHNVSASPQRENKTFELANLKPNQECQVWIKAVTEAGPGANVTTSFITKQPEHLVLQSKSHIFAPLLGLLVIMCCLFALYSLHQGSSKTCLCINENVPDPYNSTIFQMLQYQAKQANEALSWISVPISEAHPTMSTLEIVLTQPPVCEHKCLPEEHTNPAGCTRQRQYGKEQQYSKMVDSAEGKDLSRVDDAGSSSEEEEQDASGYEQHFMPTAAQIRDT